MPSPTFIPHPHASPGTHVASISVSQSKSDTTFSRQKNIKKWQKFPFSRSARRSNLEVSVCGNGSLFGSLKASNSRCVIFASLGPSSLSSDVDIGDTFDCGFCDAVTAAVTVFTLVHTFHHVPQTYKTNQITVPHHAEQRKRCCAEFCSKIWPENDMCLSMARHGRFLALGNRSFSSLITNGDITVRIISLSPLRAPQLVGYKMS